MVVSTLTRFSGDADADEGDDGEDKGNDITGMVMVILPWRFRDNIL